MTRRQWEALLTEQCDEVITFAGLSRDYCVNAMVACEQRTMWHEYDPIMAAHLDTRAIAWFVESHYRGTP